MTTAPSQKSFNLINGGNPGRIDADNGSALEGSILYHGGTVQLNGATPVVVADAYVTGNSMIFFTIKTPGGTVSPNAPNALTVTPGTGFTVGGTALDTSIYNYVVIG